MEARLVPLLVETVTMVKSELNLAARTRHTASRAWQALVKQQLDMTTTANQEVRGA